MLYSEVLSFGEDLGEVLVFIDLIPCPSPKRRREVLRILNRLYL
jgi:hypothetical protein